MKSLEKVSVIVPAYNVAAWLGECIESILSQTYDNLEIIIVNDGSTDDTPTVARSFASRDGRVRVIDRDNGGLSMARNTGIDASTGDWLCFVDGDDLLPPHAIEMLLANVGTASVSSGNLKRFYDSIPVVSQSHKPKIISGLDAAEEVLYRRDRGVSASACGKIFRRDFWGDRRFTPGILYEDLDLIPRVLESAREVAVCGDITYLYRQHRSSILGEWSPRRLEVLDVAQRLVNDFADDPRLATAASDRLVSAAFNMIIQMRRAKYVDAEAKARCKSIIRERRSISLGSSKIRFKNRVALVMSYLFI